MDYLDPKKQFRHRIILLTGYVLIAVAIVLGTRVLVKQAEGFGLDRNGTVIQSGLLYFSSLPSSADIYINGTRKNVQTNTRLSLPEGIYNVRLKKAGYHDWQRKIELDGGHVEHYDYPFLFPKELATKTIQPYPVAPELATQSPDRRWLIISQPGSSTSFSVRDIKNPDKAPVSITLPAALISKANSAESWQLGEWADDNQHVLLRHIYDDKTEFILLDRVNPDQSLNLNQTLATNPTHLTLKDKKYDLYYLYNAVEQSLQTATLKAPTILPLFSRVAAYQSYGADMMLYATDNGAPAGQVLVKLAVGDQIYPIRTLPRGSAYLLDLTKYSNKFYVAVGATSGEKVYIYKDPVGQLNKDPKYAIAPLQVLHVAQPNYVSFSNNAQFIVAENSTKFGVYDIENKTGYNYTSPDSMDLPQLHATWMDGHRLTYTSQGKLAIFDYDGTNHQTLLPTSSSYLPFFRPDYKFVYLFSPAATGSQLNLTQISLLVKPRP